MERKTAENL
ncbi:hypothetical protein GBAR_LOCUS18208 [Geodia barretti]|uniref:Uncharacterized protein n=1 Tax=Geodia barretti TaxID=519541 RepID=A0AA35SM87_GEOBA|nr:hypothetical protein GBAR_LOCUS18208 [Geodia barretti]